MATKVPFSFRRSTPWPARILTPIHHRARENEQIAAVTLALTSPGSDEKPLLVRMAPGNSRVIALGDAAAPSDHATAGVYAVRPLDFP